MVTEPVIECRKATVRYGELTVLEEVNVVVERRQTLCLVGPNGGGKSTFLKLILGMVRPQRGSVRVFGRAPWRVRQRIGYMPQGVQFDPLFPIEVESIVRMGRINGFRSGPARREDRLATERVLEEMELLPYRRERFAHLSGGMKQRVLIARALVGEPELLLLDEPTAMVDAHSEARLLERLRKLHEELTLVMVSHDTAFVSALVDEVLCVNRTALLHPLETVRDASIESLYGGPMRAVVHKHALSTGEERGHD